jgi:hypothetical protein
MGKLYNIKKQEKIVDNLTQSILNNVFRGDL